MRQIIVDTETTGLDANEGHKIIEFVALEMLDRQPTNNFIQFYLNPERTIDEGASKIHGITIEQLLDKPKFADVVDQIITFVSGSEVIIHNAKFDLSFLNKEFLLIKNRTFESYISKVTDTLVMARRKFPNARNSLDVLCDRFKIDKSSRSMHGALIDCKLLADVYLKLTEEQINLLSFDDKLNNSVNDNIKFSKFDSTNITLKVVKANDIELEQHSQYLQKLKKTSNDQCEWFNFTEKNPGKWN